MRRGIRRERLRLVRNGHDAVPPLPLSGGAAVRLGYLANFRPEKGHLRLLEALTRVRVGTPWICVLAGEGPLAEAVARRAAELGLAERVEFVGEVKDSRAFWASTDIAVLSQITRAPRTRSSKRRSPVARSLAPRSAARPR